MADDLNSLISKLNQVRQVAKELQAQIDSLNMSYEKMGDFSRGQPFYQYVADLKQANALIKELESRIRSLRTSSGIGSTTTTGPITDLRKQVESLVRANLRGKGTATQAGIDRVVDDALANREISQRRRVEGGQYLSMAKGFREQLSNVGNQPPPSKILTQAEEALIKKLETEANKRIKADEEVIASSKKLDDAQEKLAAKLREEEALRSMFEGLEEPEPTPSTIVPPSLSTKGAKGKAALPSIDEQLKEIGETYGDKLSAKINKTIQSTKELQSAVTKINVTKGKELADGFTQFNVALNNTNSKVIPTVQKLNLYLSKTGEILDKVAYEAQKAPKFTLPGLGSVVGSDRIDKALNSVKQYGFALENLQKVRTHQPTGVTFFEFARNNEGVIETQTVAMDKFGKTLTFTNKRLQDFFTSIKNNTIEVLKWSIGASLVYTSIFKLQEIVKIAVDNEAKLADITITLGNAQRDVNAIFEDAAKIAVASGESINGVLEAYAFAYRAVGGVVDPIQRTVSANRLLTDSIILSKLSALDEAQAIDVLSGALRQLQKPGEDVSEAFKLGTDLLDKWVAVTNRANVDLATLSTAFSITSESADNAGVSIEELNAIIALLAEKIGGLGGRETGNAVRALIGGIYQDQAAKALSNYGISVADTTGKMRPFLDISEEIYNLYQGGVIDTDELNKLAYILGGGVRRGQQYVAFLSDLGRVGEIVEIQANATGAAELALGKKLDTVQTATTNLGNAFQQLAQTIGTDGGVLDLLKGVLSTVNLLVDGITLLSKALGRVTIPAALLAFMAMAFSGTGGNIKRAQFLSGVENTLLGKGVSKVLGRNELGMTDDLVMMGATQYPGAMGKLRGNVGGAALGIGLGAIPAISRASQGEYAGAGADIGGAIIGTLISGGNPIGGVIGAAIADAFISETLAYESKFENFFSQVFPKVEEPPTGKEDTLQKEKEDIASEAFKRAGMGNEFLGKLSARLQAFAANTALGLYGAKTNQKFGTVTPEQAALDLASRGGGNADLIRRIQEANRKTVRPEANVETSGVYQEQLDLIDKKRDELDKLQEQLREETLQKLFKGDIKAKDYLERNLGIQGLDATLSKFYVAFGENFDKMNDDVEGSGEVFRAFADLLLEGSEEDTQKIEELVSEIFVLRANLEDLKETGAEAFNFKGVDINAEEAKKALASNVDLATKYINSLIEEQRKKITILPGIIELDIKEIDFTKVEQEARRLEGIYLAALTPSEQEKYLAEKEIEMNLIKMWDNANTEFYKRVSGKEGAPGEEFYSQAFTNLADTGTINPIDQKGLDIQQFDVSLAQLEQAIALSESLLPKFIEKGYKPDRQEQIAIANDGYVKPLKADWKIVQLLLQEILDVEKDQLDGIYNLPTDASFYVPFQGYELGFTNKMNSGLEDFLKSLEFLGGAIDETATEISAKNKVSVEQILEKRRSRQFDPGALEKSQVNTLTKQPITSYDVGRRKADDTGIVPELSISDRIQQFLNNLRNEILKLNIGTGVGYFVGSGKTPKTDTTSLKSLFGTDRGLQKVETKLSLNLNSNIQLVVDGRILANIVKQYLYTDMVASENSTTAITRTIAI